MCGSDMKSLMRYIKQGESKYTKYCLVFYDEDNIIKIKRIFFKYILENSS